MPETAELIFYVDEQVYRVGGEIYDRVTDILKSADLYNFSAVPPDKLAYACARGRAAHLACQFIDEGNIRRDTIDPAISGHVRAYETFRADMGSRIIISKMEHPFFSTELKLAGRPDRIFLIDGWPYVVDLKCTATRSRTTAIQTAGYKLLAQPHYDKDLKRAELHLQKNGRYTFTEFNEPENEYDESVFMSCLTVHRWKKAA